MAINLCITYTEVVVVVGGLILYRQIVLVSFHSLKTMDLGPLRGLGPLFSRNGAILGHSPIHKKHEFDQYTKGGHFCAAHMALMTLFFTLVRSQNLDNFDTTMYVILVICCRRAIVDTRLCDWPDGYTMERNGFMT